VSQIPPKIPNSILGPIAVFSIGLFFFAMAVIFAAIGKTIEEHNRALKAKGQPALVQATPSPSPEVPRTVAD
jgi:hypothetical protein